MKKTEIRITGYGGQGVIKSGYIIGKAAAIYDDLNATLNQSFGPEARGSACSAQVIISDSKILYPYLQVPLIMIAMSQEGYNKYKGEVPNKGVILIDSDLVKAKDKSSKVRHYEIPATRFAEELGRKIVLNIIMLGFFTAVTKLVEVDSMRDAVKTSVPERTIELNLQAFEKGYEYGLEQLKN